MGDYRLFGLKGQRSLAQGNALGLGVSHKSSALKGRHSTKILRAVSPIQGCRCGGVHVFQGVALAFPSGRYWLACVHGVSLRMTCVRLLELCA